jgi:nitrite reductase/ring-hydroxylating ferredoxin subunit
MNDDVKVYVIGSAEGLERGQAKAFSLSRVTATEEGRPYSIFVVRSQNDEYFGYVNTCPHQGAWLNIGDGLFFGDDPTRLRCGRHKSQFDIASGVCVDGPCKDKALEPVAIVVIDGELCLCGVELKEEEPRLNYDDDFDDTMEIMISPD